MFVFECNIVKYHLQLIDKNLEAALRLQDEKKKKKRTSGVKLAYMLSL